MRYFDLENPAPQPRPAMTAPAPSPMPLARGVWSRVDHEYPGYLVVELWTGDGQCVTVARTTVAWFEHRRVQLAVDLDAFDPMHRHLKAV